MGEIEISLDSLPAYLRGEGHPALAEEIERAGRDAKALRPVLERAAAELDGEAREVVAGFARLMRQTEGM